MSSLILYFVTFLLITISYKKDKEKTKKALLKGWKSIEGILPQFLGIILIVGITLAILRPEIISNIVGNNSGVIGVFLSAIIGSIAMMPTFVAFSLGNTLLLNGAGYSQVGALVSSLVLIGLMTFPLEAKYIGKRAAFLRNLIAFLFSIIVGIILGRIMMLI